MMLQIFHLRKAILLSEFSFSAFLMFYFPHFEVRSKRILVIKYFKLNTHKIEDPKTLIRNRKSNDSHYNGQKKKEKNDGEL